MFSLAENDFHKQAAVITRSVGKQTSKDKPDTQESKQSALNDKTTVNDDAISSGNSIHFIILLLLSMLLFFYLQCTFLVYGHSFPLS